MAALGTNGASATKPRYNCLSYGLYLDKGAAYWLSNDKKPDEWTAQFFTHEAPGDEPEWRLRVDTSRPLGVTVIEMSYGLPHFPGIKPRPDHLIAEPNTTLDWGRKLRSGRTFVTKSFTFPVNRREAVSAP